MNKELFEENDRNIRVFGLETQKKLFESEVLIMNITPMMSELCKNLILSGAGICLFDNNSKIEKIDVENNFFFNLMDIKKNKVETLKEKIKSFKQNCKINIVKDINEIKRKNMKYSIIDLSNENQNINDLKKEIEKIMNENKGILYYIKIKEDMSIFMNNILEKKLIDNIEKKDNSIIFVKDENIIEHMDLSDDENSLEANEKENNNKKEEKPIEILNEDDEKGKEKEMILNDNDYEFLEMKEKINKIKELIPKNIKKNEEEIIVNCFELFSNGNSLNQKNPLNTLCNYIIGGIVCHEIINCISKKKNPRTNIYYYDSFKGIGKFLNELYDKNIN